MFCYNLLGFLCFSLLSLVSLVNCEISGVWEGLGLGYYTVLTGFSARFGGDVGCLGCSSGLVCYSFLSLFWGFLSVFLIWLWYYLVLWWSSLVVTVLFSCYSGTSEVFVWYWVMVYWAYWAYSGICCLFSFIGYCVLWCLLVGCWVLFVHYLGVVWVLFGLVSHLLLGFLYYCWLFIILLLDYLCFVGFSLRFFVLLCC